MRFADDVVEIVSHGCVDLWMNPCNEDKSLFKNVGLGV